MKIWLNYIINELNYIKKNLIKLGFTSKQK